MRLSLSVVGKTFSFFGKIKLYEFNLKIKTIRKNYYDNNKSKKNGIQNNRKAFILYLLNIHILENNIQNNSIVLR